MRSLIFCCGVFFLSLAASAQSTGYSVTKTFKIASGGGWDYIAVNDHKIYASHASQVNILNEATGDSLGVIPNTTGVHGIAFNPSLNKGYTSNGRLNTITVFDLTTNAVLSQIPVGQNPDAIMYDPFSKKVITCNGRSNDLSIVDPITEKVTMTIKLSGKPETAISDEAGKLFVNIEDKNAISQVDLTTGKVISTWTLSPAEGPTGLAIDLKTNRLFAGCEKMLVVVDAVSGNVLQRLPIGEGCDGIAFDDGIKLIFASCGEGNVYVAEENATGECKIVDKIATKRSARTITVDPQNHQAFLPAADMGPSVNNQRPPMIPGSFQIMVLAK